MKTLALMSYICSFLSFMAIGVLAADEINWSRALRDDDAMILLMLVFPVLQMFYVRRLAAVLHLPPYRQTRMLDELAMHDGELDVDVVGTNGFWQGVVVVNSLLLSGLVLVMTSMMPYLLDLLKYEKGSDLISLLFFLSAYFFAVPTIIFNLRTFYVRRIKGRHDAPQ